jgi:hypothetical protein
MASSDEGLNVIYRVIDEVEAMDRKAEADYRRNRTEPTTASGREWRRAELMAEKLAESGETYGSFVIKSMIGYAGMVALPALLLWVAWQVFKAFIGF